MSGDWMDDPEAKAWAAHVVEELAPMIKSSAVTVSIAPTGETDVKFAVELGFSIMMGKPILLAVQHGQRIPGKLIQVADEIVEIDYDKPAAAAKAISAAMGRILAGLVT